MAHRPPALIAIDVDGTLLTADHRVTRATLTALDHARSRGVEVLLATSRGPRAVEAVLRATGLVAPAVFVGCQGALTGTYGDDGLVVLDRRPAPLDDALRLVGDARAAGLAAHWFSGEDWLVSHVDHTVEAEIATVGCEPEVADLSGLDSGPDKVMLISPTEDASELRVLAEHLPSSLQAQPSNPRYLEITRRGVHKGTAVRAHAERRGIDPAAVVAIGDGPNDLGLFEYAGTSVAPANAHAEVLAAADHVTRSNDDDGVALALHSLVP